MGRKTSLSLLMALSAGAFLSFVVEAFMSCDASALTQHSISISTDVQTLESTVNTDPEGSMIIQKHVVTLNTDNPRGLKLFVNAKDDKTTPTYVAGSGPAGASGLTAIGQATGSDSNPRVLSTNRFGFATAKETDAMYNEFSPQSVYESTDESVRRQAKFGKLEELEDSFYFYAKEGSHVNKQIPIYYGTNVNSLMREGKYEVDVIYTVMSHDFLSLSSWGNRHMEYGPKRMLVRDDQNFYGDNTVTIRTDIKSNRPIEVDRVRVEVGGKKCTDVNITQNFSENADKNLEVTCKAPKNLGSSAGVKYKIDVKIGIGYRGISFSDYAGVEYVIPETMQGFQHSQCTAMQTHEEKTLVDTRDGQLYTVAKLNDGKCWMTQNLRYQLSTTRVLTPQDSDVRQNWTPNRSTETTLAGRWDQDPEGQKTVHSYYDSTKPEHGAYYTHTAATAGTTANMNNDGDEATGSICPKGWRLPKTGTVSDSPNNDFYNLSKEYRGSATWDHNNGWGYWNDSDQMLTGEPKYVLSGYRDPSYAGVYSTSSYGYWWPSTVYSSYSAYYMNIYSEYVSSVSPRSNGSRYNGFSVRCLAREPKTIGNIEYMQDMTPEHCANSTEHQVATLKDKRDNNTYTVAKLKDGKCWMTENLRLKLDTSTPLKPTDSDVSSNWTPNRSTDIASCQSGIHWDQDSEGNKTVRSCYQSESTYNTNGVYYTHTAATAGTTTNMNNNGDEATGSICPKGWRLPKTGTIAKSTNNDFYNMAQHYIGSMSWYDDSSDYGYWQNGIHNMLSSPPNFIYSGLRWHDADGVANVGGRGLWWSSTVRSSYYAYSLYMYSDYVGPRYDFSNSSDGFAVRCIAR